MSRRGIDFVENWINTNVTDADLKGSQSRANELAAHYAAVRDRRERNETLPYYIDPPSPFNRAGL
jgi:hypothetical protein